MIYKVETSLQAEEDLRGIFEYIAFELLSPENAGAIFKIWQRAMA